MANFIPIQLDRQTGKQHATRAGLQGLGPPPGPGFSITWGYTHIQALPDFTWVIPHNGNSENLQVQVFDSSNELVIPDIVRVVDANTVEIDFGAPMSGKAQLIIFST